MAKRMTTAEAMKFARDGGNVNTDMLREMIHQCFEEITTLRSSNETLNRRVSELEKHGYHLAEAVEDLEDTQQPMVLEEREAILKGESFEEE